MPSLAKGAAHAGGRFPITALPAQHAFDAGSLHTRGTVHVGRSRRWIIQVLPPEWVSDGARLIVGCSPPSVYSIR